MSHEAALSLQESMIWEVVELGRLGGGLSVSERIS